MRVTWSLTASLSWAQLGLSWAPLCFLPSIRHKTQASPSLPLPPHCPHLSTSALWLGLVTAAMYCMMCLLASVFPAPLSPANNRWTVRIFGCSPSASSLCPPVLPGTTTTTQSLTNENTGTQEGYEPAPGPLNARQVPEITMQVSLDRRFIAL